MYCVLLQFDIQYLLTVYRLASADELCSAPRVDAVADSAPAAAVLDALDSLPLVDSAADLRKDTFVDLLDIFEVRAWAPLLVR